MEFYYTPERFRFKKKIEPHEVPELAKRLGVGEQTVFRWIAGQTVPPAPMRERIKRLQDY